MVADFVALFDEVVVSASALPGYKTLFVFSMGLAFCHVLLLLQAVSCLLCSCSQLLTEYSHSKLMEGSLRYMGSLFGLSWP